MKWEWEFLYPGRAGENVKFKCGGSSESQALETVIKIGVAGAGGDARKAISA